VGLFAVCNNNDDDNNDYDDNNNARSITGSSHPANDRHSRYVFFAKKEIRIAFQQKDCGHFKRKKECVLQSQWNEKSRICFGKMAKLRSDLIDFVLLAGLLAGNTGLWLWYTPVWGELGVQGIDAQKEDHFATFRISNKHLLR
jgi:hypothetical protein